MAETFEGAKHARGLVVVDVFRAFTTASLFLEQGAAGIVPVASLDRARALREEFRRKRPRRGRSGGAGPRLSLPR